MVLSSRSGRIATALLYFAVISFLFCLPGSAFPKNNWLSKVHFDKWVHIGFFALLLVLWLWALHRVSGVLCGCCSLLRCMAYV
jgi:hypothetical protein